jgi:hypothetical protein
LAPRRIAIFGDFAQTFGHFLSFFGAFGGFLRFRRIGWKNGSCLSRRITFERPTAISN